MNGDSLDFALYRVAGGRDQLARVTVRDFDLDQPERQYDRKTIARALEELMELGCARAGGPAQGLAGP